MKDVAARKNDAQLGELADKLVPFKNLKLTNDAEIKDLASFLAHSSMSLTTMALHDPKPEEAAVGGGPAPLMPRTLIPPIHQYGNELFHRSGI